MRELKQEIKMMNKNIGFDVFHKRVKLEGTLKLASGLRIGAGRALGPTASDLPILRDFSDQPFIPGSSFKGVLRSNLESWLRALEPGNWEWIACDPTDRDSRCIDSKMKKKITSEDNKDITELVKRFGGADQALLEQACWICKLFGSPWAASKVYIVDMPVKGDWRTEWLMVRDGVVIDRESETAKSKGKYDFEAVPSGIEFQMEIIVENPEPYEMGLLAVGIELFNGGFILLGGDTSRGLGRITVSIEKMVEVTAEELLAKLQPRSEKSEQDVEETAQENLDEAKAELPETPDEILQELIGCLAESGSLNHDGLVSKMQQKNIKKDKLKEKGYDNWKKLFEKAVKENLIVLSQEGLYHLPGVQPEPAKEDSRMEEKSRELEEGTHQNDEKLKEWKAALWKKLQPEERNLERERWKSFREELNKKEVEANV
jgi:CRISPR-associated RAMP protein (TIGR02581 family)